MLQHSSTVSNETSTNISERTSSSPVSPASPLFRSDVVPTETKGESPTEIPAYQTLASAFGNMSSLSPPVVSQNSTKFQPTAIVATSAVIVRPSPQGSVVHDMSTTSRRRRMRDLNSKKYHSTNGTTRGSKTCFPKSLKTLYTAWCLPHVVYGVRLQNWDSH